MTNGTKTPFAASALVQVDRAAADLRRGLPVILQGKDGETAVILAAEDLESSHFSDFLDFAAGKPCHLVLTHQRAEILRMRLYTDDVVYLALSDHKFDHRAIAALADPTSDMAHPLRGPFLSEREAPTSLGAAAAKLAKLADLLPAVLILPNANSGASGGFTAANADDILDYDEEDARQLHLVTRARVPLEGAEDTQLIAFRPKHGGTEHFAIQVGQPSPPGPVLVRLHSECFTGDLLGSLKCDCGEQLRGAIKAMDEAGGGIVLYLAQEGRGIGLINKLRAYQLQDQGFDTMEANGRLGFEDDERLFDPAAQMLKLMGFTQINLMTNNPDKVAGIEAKGVKVVERVGHKFPPNPHNEAYLLVKKAKAGHDL